MLPFVSLLELSSSPGHSVAPVSLADALAILTGGAGGGEVREAVDGTDALLVSSMLLQLELRPPVSLACSPLGSRVPPAARPRAELS